MSFTIPEYQVQIKSAQTATLFSQIIGNSVIDGLTPSAGAGLTLNLAAGDARIEGYWVSMVSSTQTMTASSTNYVYLQLVKSGGNVTGQQYVTNTTGIAPSDSMLIATVTTNGSAITGVTDNRYVGVNAQSLFFSSNPSITQASIGADPSSDLVLNAPAGASILFQINAAANYLNISSTIAQFNESLQIAGSEWITGGLSLNQTNAVPAIGTTVSIYHAAGDANPSVQLGDGFLKFGAGGATALGLQLSRTTSGFLGATNGFLFDTLVVNDAGVLLIRPSGTATTSGLEIYAQNSLTTGSVGLFVATSTYIGIQSRPVGIGSTLPIIFYMGPTPTEAFRITTTPSIQWSTGVLHTNLTMGGALNLNRQMINNVNSINSGTGLTQVWFGSTGDQYIAFYTTDGLGGQSERFHINYGAAQGSAGIESFETIYFGANTTGFAYASQAAILADAAGGNLIVNAPTGKIITLQLNGSTVLGVLATELQPAADNTIALGESGKRFSSVYAVNVVAGDVHFSNGWRLTETDKLGMKREGIALVTKSGKVAKIWYGE